MAGFIWSTFAPPKETVFSLPKSGRRRRIAERKVGVRWALRRALSVTRVLSATRVLSVTRVLSALTVRLLNYSQCWNGAYPGCSSEICVGCWRVWEDMIVLFIFTSPTSPKLLGIFRGYTYCNAKGKGESRCKCELYLFSIQCRIHFFGTKPLPGIPVGQKKSCDTNSFWSTGHSEIFSHFLQKKGYIFRFEVVCSSNFSNIRLN